MSEADAIKDEGNVLFKEGRYEEALSCYTRALKLSDSDNSSATYYKNRAACFLKMNKDVEALKDTTAALEICPNDPKALFRRCQAYENLDKTAEAYKDAVHLLKVEPKNAAIQPILRRLNKLMQEKVVQQNSFESKLQQMLNIMFDASGNIEREKKITAANNLIVLARDEAGATEIIKNNGIKLLNTLVPHKDLELLTAVIRVFSCLVKHRRDKVMEIYETLTLKNIIIVMGLPNEDVSTAAAHLLQFIINAVTGIDVQREKKKQLDEDKKKYKNLQEKCPPLKLDDDSQEFVDEVFIALLKLLPNGKVSGFGRDSAMEILIKNVTRSDGLAWTAKFIEKGGIQCVLTVAGTIRQHKTLDITEQTPMHSSILLSKVYDDTSGDKEREKYRAACENHLVEMLGDDSMDSKLEAVEAICALLRGPFDAGNAILSRDGIMPIMLAMANSENLIYQRVAIEALVLSASKKDKCSGIIKDAVPILKALYNSKTDSVKVRALVGLCKLGSYGGTDASAKSFAEGSTLTLAKACRKFLNDPKKDIDLRKWATEGLAYLTLDADVKEELADDTKALKAIIDLAKTPYSTRLGADDDKKPDSSILYPAVQVFVNLTNSYDKPDIMPEMLELAKYSKQHVPEEHPKDKEEFVKARVDKLVKAGVCAALHELAKTDSHSSRELLARIFLAITSDPTHRGLCVQQGGAKALIPLALEGTAEGKLKAAQALARIAITINPENAFPGQRSLEVVRPLNQLLHIDCTGLQNFEALMALTNLASMSDSVRKRMLKEGCISNVEHWMFEEHDMIKRAATECMCNLVMCEDVANLFLGENDRVKLLLLYVAEEDPLLVRAAAGALAILSSSREVCNKIIGVNGWFELLQMLMVHDFPDIQERGTYILLSMMSADKELAQRLVESPLFELLLALSRIEDADRVKAKQYAQQALEKAAEWSLVKPNKDAPKS